MEIPATDMLKLRVERIAALTPRIRQLELVAAEGGELPAFTAGGHIGVDIGEGEARTYSLLNAPHERGRYVIAVLLEPQGRGGSAWMHGSVRQGDVITTTLPMNNFSLNEAAEESLLIAGGIGITPILSMVERLLEKEARFVLHYATRSRDDAPFAAELERRLGERLVLHHDNGDPAQGVNLPALLAKRAPGAHVYVCGPRGMIEATRTATQHWPKGTVHFELFSGAIEDTTPRSSDTAFEMELAKSGRVVMVPADRSPLDALRDIGIKVKSMCKDGVCGTCRVRVLSGAVDHRDEVLTDKEHASFMQVCVSRAMPGERLVLDL